MKKLAIKGQNENPEEVIDILEKLGGTNPNDYVGNGNDYYFLDYKNRITAAFTLSKDNYVIYNVAEFSKAFYDIGDTVLYCGKNVSIKRIRWNEEKETIEYEIEGKGFISNLEEDYETDKAKAPVLYGTDGIGGRCIYNIPARLEIESIEKDKIILKPRKIEYPTTFSECCEIMGYTEDILETYCLSGYKAKELLCTFQKLLLCRDAYWKVSHDWFPSEGVQQYVLKATFSQIQIVQETCTDVPHIFSFSSEKACSQFYRCFEKELKLCKEFVL